VATRFELPNVAQITVCKWARLACSVAASSDGDKCSDINLRLRLLCKMYRNADLQVNHYFLPQTSRPQGVCLLGIHRQPSPSRTVMLRSTDGEWHPCSFLANTVLFPRPKIVTASKCMCYRNAHTCIRTDLFLQISDSYAFSSNCFCHLVLSWIQTETGCHTCIPACETEVKP
jgi:hypothetical protein